MVRKGGGSTQRMAPPPITNGLANGNPPPSTIAAQIVHNASNINARHESASKVTFGELLKEFLAHPNTDEPDTQMVALICVVAEAGLESLSKDDPFAQDQQRQQGVDSVAAIKLIVKKRPHLLLSPKDIESEGSSPPPLLLWLFPKLLGLLTHATLQHIHEQVQGLLSICLSILAQSSALWNRASTVLRLYQSSVQRMSSVRPLLDSLTRK